MAVAAFLAGGRGGLDGVWRGLERGVLSLFCCFAMIFLVEVFF